MLAAARALAQKSPALKNSSAPLLSPLTELRPVAAKIAVAVGIQAQKQALPQSWPRMNFAGKSSPLNGHRPTHPIRISDSLPARDSKLKLNQAAAGGSSDGFGPADDVHLSEDGFDVRLHCAFADEKRRADLLVAFSLSHQLEHVDLARA